MTKWLIGGVVLVATVAGVCYFGTPKPIPSAVAPAEVTATATTPAPFLPNPAIHTLVVDVTDIDPFLDPPMIPLSESTTLGPVHSTVGYEEGAFPPILAPVKVVPIPPALEDDELAAAEPNLLILPKPGAETLPLAPMPRELGYAADDCVPVSGPILLDMVAASLVPDEVVKSAYHVFNDFDQFTITLAFSCQSIVKATPLAPLFVLTDSHLLQQRTEAGVTTAVSPVAASPSRPTSVWVPEPVVPSETRSATTRRIFALGHVGAQAPATRSEWYTRWYGTTRLPQQVGTQWTSEQIRDGEHLHLPAQSEACFCFYYSIFPGR